jgi:ribose transport system ATP-binding protein
MIYISHRLKEIESLCDRVAGLRDGRNSGELPRERICRDEMLRLMVGRDVAQFYRRAGQARDGVALEVRGLEVRGRAGRPVSFQIRAGEIVGLAGLVGSGRTEIAHTLFGITAPLAGEILLDGKPVVIRSPRDAIRAGLALVPEDRKAQGVILEMSIEENVALPSLPRHQRFGWVRRAPLSALASDLTKRLAIRTPSITQQVQMLSGGNQQKVVLAKWLALKPRVLLLDDPTRGIDVVAKEEIYRLMEQLAGEGVAILLISSELQEVLGVADRVLVMSEGRLAGELPETEFSEEAVMHLATGGKAQS